MRTKLGRAYYGFAAAALAVCTLGLVATADAAEPPAVLASGYGSDTMLSGEPRAGSRARAITACLDAAADRYEGEVSLASVNRAWEGSEGWILDISLDVAREGGRPRRRDALCRQGEHGLQVARY